VKRLALALFSVLFGMVCMAGVWVGHWYKHIHAPIGSIEGPTTVEIPSGHFSKSVETLESAGLLKMPLYFRVLARVRKAERQVRPGRYEIGVGTTPSQLLDRITGSGPGGAIRLTVPEGWTLYHVAERVEAEGVDSREEFLKVATDAGLLRRLKIRGPSAEGYLFPDTYYFKRGTRSKGVIERMVRRHRQVFEDVVEEVGRSRVSQLKSKHKLTDRQLIILASIVEREAVVDEERPIISRVFFNRLEKKMKLQTDPTCVYGPTLYQKKPSPKLCRDPASLYSTYVIDALPPGPISNPGRASLRAALMPTTKAAQRDYLFFVAKRDGRHHTFSRTYEEHTKAIPR
jgi:UPF0755 protein